MSVLENIKQHRS